MRCLFVPQGKRRNTPEYTRIHPNTPRIHPKPAANTFRIHPPAHKKVVIFWWPTVVDLVRFVSAPNVFEDSSVRSHFAQVQASVSPLLFLQRDKMSKTLLKHKLTARLTRKTMCKRELTTLHRLRNILAVLLDGVGDAVMLEYHREALQGRPKTSTGGRPANGIFISVLFGSARGNRDHGSQR